MKLKLYQKMLVVALAVSLILFLSGGVSAQPISGSCGDSVMWQLDTDTGLLEISGTGPMYDYGNDYDVEFDDEPERPPFYEYRDIITQLIIGDGVTYIGFSAFSDMRNLAAVTFGKDITAISTAFGGCISLVSLQFPEGLEVIGEYAFSHCLNLESSNFPSSLRVIDEGAFWQCYKLRDIILPESLELIGSYAFAECESLTEINIPNNVISIGRVAFSGCTGVESVTIGTGLEDIGDYAFSDGNYTSVNVPASVKSIAISPFTMSDSLEEITVDGDSEYYTSVNGVLFSKDMKTLVQYPGGKSGTSYVVPTGVEMIITQAFAWAHNLNTITLSKDVRTEGEGVAAAFSLSSSVEAIIVDENNDHYASESGVLFSKNMKVLLTYPQSKPETTYQAPSGVERIEDNAFANVLNVENVILPESVTYVGHNFLNGYGLASIKAVTFYASEPPSINVRVRDGYTVTKVYVPQNSVLDYYAVLPDMPIYVIGQQTAAAISITKHPTSTSVIPGNITGNLNVTASVTESAAVFYQWYRNTSNSNTGGTAIAGATSAVFSIPTSLSAGKYYYYCEVNATGGATAKKSNVATITVAVPEITITSHPAASTTVTAGSVIGNLNVTASVTQGATLSYQWYNASSNSNTSGTAISGATKASFAIPTNLTEGSYYYFCEVRATGSAVAKRSNVATVVVNAVGTISIEKAYVNYLATFAGMTRSEVENKLVTDKPGEKFNVFTSSAATAGPWCNAFIHQTAKAFFGDNLIIPTGGSGTMRDSLLKPSYGGEIVTEPQIGDIFLFSGTGHIGIVCNVAVDGSWVELLHGNYHNGRFPVEGKTDTYYFNKTIVSTPSSILSENGIPTSKACPFCTERWSITRQPTTSTPGTISRSGWSENVTFIRPNYNAAAKSFAGTVKYTFNCPIDVKIIYNEEELNSATGLFVASWGIMQVEGESITVVLEYGNTYNILVTGTGDGTMSLEVTFDTNHGQDSRSFVNMPITPSTMVYVYANAADCGVELHVTDDNESTDDEIWFANPSETVTNANEDATREYLLLYRYSGEGGMDHDDKENEEGKESSVDNTNGGINGNSDAPSDMNPSSSFSGGSTYASASGLDLMLTINKDFNLFKEVRVDNSIIIRNEDYHAESGSTVVTLLSSFLDTLAAGEHTLAVHFADGAIVTVKFSIIPSTAAWPSIFNDVATDAWYSDAVRYCFENGLMNGTGNNMFSPDSTLTRAMMVTILHRLAGSPQAEDHGFIDTSHDAWYSEAVSWASASGVINGMGDDLFAPGQSITREQMAVMLYRYISAMGIEIPVTREFGAFRDAGNVSSWAIEATNCMYEAQILNGKGDDIFDPKGTATRAEVAQLFTNFMEMI